MRSGLCTVTVAWALGTGFIACSSGDIRRDGPSCGNGVVEPGEECDPPNSYSCDTDCRAFLCFGPGTLIATPEGNRPIERVAAGDLVWSWKQREAVAVARRVVAVHKAHVSTFCELRTESARLASVTPAHPLFLPDEGRYLPVRDLTQGCRLLVMARSEEGPKGAPQCREEPLLDVKVTERSEPIVEVYHLSVEGPELNFFADGVLAHNKQIYDPPICGNGVPDWLEGCDDGNVSDEDACLTNCQPAHCGDGVVWAGVECCDPPDGIACDMSCMCLAAGGSGAGGAGGTGSGGTGGGGAGGSASGAGSGTGGAGGGGGAGASGGSSGTGGSGG